MNNSSWFRAILHSFVRKISATGLRYEFTRRNNLETFHELGVKKELNDKTSCPSCGMPIGSYSTDGLSWSHNSETCRLVNIVLAEVGVSFDQFIRVNIYAHFGPLKGYYSPADPLTIHISDQAYSQFPEYIIFHETKHLVDCLTKGWSEEGTPDSFARSLCAKHGFRCPPHNQDYDRVSSFGLLLTG